MLESGTKSNMDATAAVQEAAKFGVVSGGVGNSALLVSSAQGDRRAKSQEQAAADAESSPEWVTDDELFGPTDEADERLIDAAFREHGLDNVDSLPEVGEDLVDVEEEDDTKHILRQPGDPTAEEYETHRVDHLPYRSWCPHCVNGKATGRQHKPRSTDQDDMIPQLGFDYLHGSESLALATGGEEIIKILVAKCHASKCIFATWFPRKA